MTDDTGLPTPEPPTPSGPSSTEAWNDVLARMSDLGEAVTRWAKATANEPDTKQKLDQVRAGINDIGQKADAALGRAVRSDIGNQVREGAEQAGQAFSDAAQHVTQAAAPHMKSAFAGLSDVFGKAAAKVDEAAHRHQSETTAHAEDTAPAQTAPPASPATPETPVATAVPTEDNPPAPKDE